MNENLSFYVIFGISALSLITIIIVLALLLGTSIKDRSRRRELERELLIKTIRENNKYK